jgi:hypothetical protein
LDESGAWLATTPATVVQRRLTLAAIVALLLIFVAVVAFSNVPLLQSDGFIPFIQGTMFVTELATAVLLYAHFALVLSLLDLSGARRVMIRWSCWRRCVKA